MKEFKGQLAREIQLQCQRNEDDQNLDETIIREKYESLRLSGKVADWPNFYALFKDDDDKATEKIAAEAVAYIAIFEDQILEQA